MPDSQIYVQDFIKPERVRPHSTIKRHQKTGNPTPLGLSAFALSVLVLSLYNLNAFGVTTPNVVVGVSLFTGGVVQFAAGMWEFRVGNTYGGTGFSAFGGFWASYGVIYIPAFGILDAFKRADGTLDSEQFHNAMGIYCIGWLIFTFIMALASIRTSAGVLSAFTTLTASFFAEVIYNFYPHLTGALKVSGIFGLMCSASVWYVLGAVFLTPDLSPVSLPLWDLSRKDA